MGRNSEALPLLSSIASPHQPQYASPQPHRKAISLPSPTRLGVQEQVDSRQEHGYEPRRPEPPSVRMRKLGHGLARGTDREGSAQDAVLHRQEDRRRVRLELDMNPEDRSGREHTDRQRDPPYPLSQAFLSPQ